MPGAHAPARLLTRHPAPPPSPKDARKWPSDAVCCASLASMCGSEHGGVCFARCHQPREPCQLATRPVAALDTNICSMTSVIDDVSRCAPASMRGRGVRPLAVRHLPLLRFAPHGPSNNKQRKQIQSWPFFMAQSLNLAARAAREVVRGSVFIAAAAKCCCCHPVDPFAGSSHAHIRAVQQAIRAVLCKASRSRAAPGPSPNGRIWEQRHANHAKGT
jgi:hypothetical protein